jgi:hypothetical protein
MPAWSTQAKYKMLAISIISPGDFLKKHSLNPTFRADFTPDAILLN